MLKVTDLEVTQADGQVTVSALVDDYPLYFKFPDIYPVANPGDAFLCAAFFPAMKRGEDVLVDDDIAVSPELLAGIMQLQKIFACWYPKLRTFQVRASRLEPSRSPRVGGDVASFFSGGIDGLYTLLSSEQTITHLVYANGFDFEQSEEEFAQSLARNGAIAEHLGKTLIPVETNFFSFTHAVSTNRPMAHGSCLASMGHLLGFADTVVPSTYTYRELHPWGSHPLTDRLWSSEAVHFSHQGAEASRSEKTRLVAQADQYLADHLVVCWRLPDRNCGECGKCLRTATTLEILGVNSQSFAGQFSLAKLRAMRITGSGDQSYWEDISSLALEHGRPDIVRAIKFPMARFQMAYNWSRVTGLVKSGLGRA